MIYRVGDVFDASAHGGGWFERAKIVSIVNSKAQLEWWGGKSTYTEGNPYSFEGHTWSFDDVSKRLKLTESRLIERILEAYDL